MSSDYKVVAFEPDGTLIAIFDTYKRAEYYITSETEYDISEVDVGQLPHPTSLGINPRSIEGGACQ